MGIYQSQDIAAMSTNHSGLERMFSEGMLGVARRYHYRCPPSTDDMTPLVSLDELVVQILVAAIKASPQVSRSEVYFPHIGVWLATFWFLQESEHRSWMVVLVLAVSLRFLLDVI